MYSLSDHSVVADDDSLGLAVLVGGVLGFNALLKLSHTASLARAGSLGRLGLLLFSSLNESLLGIWGLLFL